MKSLKSLSIAWRVALGAIAATGAVLVLALLGATLLAVEAERKSVDTEMQARLDTVYEAMSAADQAAYKGAEHVYSALASMLEGSWTIREGGAQPMLLLNNEAMNGRSTEVDRLATITGGVATVFAKSGDDFLRITTSLKKEDGTRATGTLLGKAHPAYALVSGGKTYVGRATLFGKPYMTKYQPIVEGERVIGLLFVGLPLAADLEALYRTMRASRVLVSGQVYAVDLRDGPTLGAINGTPKGGRLDDKEPAAAQLLAALRALRERQGEAQSFTAAWSALAAAARGSEHVYLARVHPAYQWAVVAEAYGDELTGFTTMLLRPVWIATGIALLVLAGVVVWLARRAITAPLAQLEADLARLAGGDLTHPFRSARDDEIGQLTGALERVRTQIAASLRAVHASTESITTASREISQGNQDLSSRTEAQASSLQQTAASMEQMNATVQANSSASRQANELAATATHVAERGSTVFGEVVSTMDQITASSRRISEIIAVIDGIAFQTNILALNAAVEAARAGEQGRGFAVVAGEVRSLAQRSAQAAREIKGLITDSVDKVEAGSRLVNDAGGTMNDLLAQVRRVNDLIAGINAATAEQTSGISQVNQAVSALDQMTQQNAALVEQSAAAALSLHDQANQLAAAVATFKLSREESALAIRAARESSLAPAATPAAPGTPGTPATPSARARPAPVAKAATPAKAALRASQPPAAQPAPARAAAGDDWQEF